MSTNTIDNTGLYLVKGEAGKEGMLGAPLLYFTLLVNAVTGAVSGQARQKQAVQSPYDSILIENITGKIRSTGFDKYTKIVALQGSTVISFPPPAIGSYLAPFSAHFAIDDAWNGVGGWSLGNQDVENVPVKSIE